ncbi:hypothetical protein JX266_003888 [Neoarthrinium moseri]|nr:hypothetical protein JX266_003888 [Neoarthrinium moseri]
MLDSIKDKAQQVNVPDIQFEYGNAGARRGALSCPPLKDWVPTDMNVGQEVKQQNFETAKKLLEKALSTPEAEQPFRVINHESRPILVIRRLEKNGDLVPTIAVVVRSDTPQQAAEFVEVFELSWKTTKTFLKKEKNACFAIEFIAVGRDHLLAQESYPFALRNDWEFTSTQKLAG